MLGVHRFQIDADKSAYFIERPFGNIIAFADQLNDIHCDFIKSKGGVSKIFLDSFDSISEVHRNMFDKFGCYGVLDSYSEVFSDKLPLERIGKEFVDPHVIYLAHSDAKILILAQKDTTVGIFSNQYLFDQQKIFINGMDKTMDILGVIKKYNLSMLFFCNHSEVHYVNLIKPHLPLWKKIWNRLALK